MVVDQSLEVNYFLVKKQTEREINTEPKKKLKKEKELH